jgi:hypothetical protein
MEVNVIEIHYIYIYETSIMESTKAAIKERGRGRGVKEG